MSLETEYRLGASDGAHLWDLVPTLDGLGPLGEHIHCAEHDPARGKFQESLHTASLAERALLLAELLRRLAKSPACP